MTRSLQDLQRAAKSPPRNDRVWHFLRLYYKGRLAASHGDGWRALQRAGLVTAHREFTTSGRTALNRLAAEDRNDEKRRKRQR